MTRRSKTRRWMCLWEKVNDLEPVSRNPDAFAFAARTAPFASSVFVPIGHLRQSGRVECRNSFRPNAIHVTARIQSQPHPESTRNGERSSPMTLRFRVFACNAHAAEPILTSWNCQFCGFQMRVNNGIVNALPPDRAAHLCALHRQTTSASERQKAEGASRTISI